MTIDAHSTQKPLLKNENLDEMRYLNSIFALMIKKEALFCLHHFRCQIYCFFSSPEDKLFWRQGREGVGECLCTSVQYKKHTQKKPALCAQRKLFPTDKEGLVFFPSRKRKQKNGGRFGACGFKTDWKQKPL